jgi:hypothetical protein
MVPLAAEKLFVSFSSEGLGKHPISWSSLLDIQFRFWLYSTHPEVSSYHLDLLP